MKILVYRPEGNLGPYSEFDLHSMIKSGLIRSNELAWREGMKEWQPISTFVSFSSPGAGAPLPGAPISAEDATRRKYLKAEANIRSIGILYYLACFVMVLAAGAIYHATSKEPHPPIGHRILPFALVAFAALYFWMAREIRRLNPVVVLPATIIACLGMLSFPIGTIINGIILYILHCSKGHKVFTPEYREIIERTPQIVCKTSVVVKIILGLLLLVAVGLVVFLTTDFR